MTVENSIAALMTEAVMKAANPDAHALLTAERLTTDRTRPSLPPVAKRRMNQKQALTTATAVTRILRRVGLNASDVCEKAKIADPQIRAYVFTLTWKEMNEEGELVRELPESRRVHKSIDAYARIIRAAAQMAGIDPTPLLQEVGIEIADYLAPFVEADPDVYEDLATYLTMVGPYFEKTRKGVDGEPVDLGEFLSFTVREGVVYKPSTREIVTAPEEPYPGIDFEQAPSVRLFVRTVASGVAECWQYEPAPEGSGFATVRVGLGPMQVNIIEVVSLGVVREKGAMRAVLFAEPWTVTYGKPGEAASTTWLEHPSGYVSGTPFSGGLRVPDGESFFDLTFEAEPKFHCARYERYVHETLAEGLSRENDFERWYCLEEVNGARKVEIEAGILRDWLENARDEHWRVPVGFTTTPPTWAERFAVPAILTRPDGRDVSSVFDRVKHALIGSDRAIVHGLLAEVKHRVRAMDAFIEKHASEESLLKAQFRRLMRS